jgi:hypothetical protein
MIKKFAGRKLAVVIGSEQADYQRELARMRGTQEGLWIVLAPESMRQGNHLNVEGTFKAFADMMGGPDYVQSYAVAIPEGVTDYDLSFIDGKLVKNLTIVRLTATLQAVPITSLEISNMMRIYAVIKKHA